MELRHLQYFVAVCKQLHFTKAAESLGIAQPTLSQQIHVLEQEVNTPLFDRVGKRILLTEAGEILFKYSMRIFDTLEQAASDISQLKGLERGHIKIACLGTYLAMETVMDFHQRYPKIQIAVEQLSTEQIRHKLLQNELDFGVVFLPLADKELESIPLYSETLVFVTSQTHELANLKRVGFAQLKEVPLILMSRKYLVRQMFDQACQENGYDFTPTIELSEMDDLREMVEKNVGVSVLPRLYVRSMCRHSIKSIPLLDIPIKRTIGIVYRKGRHMSAVALSLMEELETFFSKLD